MTARGVMIRDEKGVSGLDSIKKASHFWEAYGAG